jgi:hypothetical protein
VKFYRKYPCLLRGVAPVHVQGVEGVA